jgi:DNA-directed RNA polymerase specialized sigma24 family protein
VPAEDAADVVQEVFLTVFKGIKTFTKDGKPAAFRRWLKAITRLKALEYWVDPWRKVNVPGGSGSWIDRVPHAGSPLGDSSEVPHTGPTPGVSSDIGGGPELRRVLELIRPDWDAFWRHVVKGDPVEKVAKELGIPPCAVEAAESRVLKHLSELTEDGVPVRLLLLRRLLELIRLDFEPRTWAAFWNTAAKGRSAADVAGELGMSDGAVYTAKSRVLNCLREEAEALGFYCAEGDVVTADIAVPVQSEVTP